MKYLFIFILSIVTLNSKGQDKEVLIIGTMHQVPEIVKNSYKPLLKYAKKYNPEAIFIETVRPSDTVSLNYDAPKFVHLSDSIKLVFSEDTVKFKELHSKDLEEFNTADFEFMSTSYLVNRDYANYSYFNYLKNHGLDGSKEPLRNENSDLSFKLAISLNLKYIYSMDDQQTRKEYHEAWAECIELGADNGDNEINNSINKKIYRKSILPALLGRLGKHTNKLKSLNQFHKVNSFRYVQFKNSACEDGTQYWDLRNSKMAKNIAEQVLQNTYTKNVVMVGAGHVIGLKEALEANYPGLKITIMYE